MLHTCCYDYHASPCPVEGLLSDTSPFESSALKCKRRSLRRSSIQSLTTGDSASARVLTNTSAQITLHNVIHEDSLSGQCLTFHAEAVKRGLRVEVFASSVESIVQLAQ